MIKAVLFDVDGVLMDSFDSIIKFYQDLFAYAGYEVPSKDTISELLHLTMMDVIKVITKSDSEDEIKRIWQLGSSRAVPYPYHLVSVPDGMSETIQQLHKKYPVAIVTSRIRGGVFEAPQLAPLEKYFTFTVYYEDTEKHKPDPEPLLLAKEKLKIDPENIVYVGDKSVDMVAAKAAGMQFILYAKENNLNTTYWTSSFRNLPELIARINS